MLVSYRKLKNTEKVERRTKVPEDPLPRDKCRYHFQAFPFSLAQGTLLHRWDCIYAILSPVAFYWIL